MIDLQPESGSDKPLEQQTGSRWIIGVVLALLATVGVNAFLVFSAVRSNKGYIEDRTWERDQAFQEVLDARGNFSSLGWIPMLSIGNANNEQPTNFSLKFNGATEQAIADLKMKLTGRRGDDASLDFTIPLERLPNGNFQGHAPRKLAGLWLLEFDIRVGPQHYQFNRREFIH